VVFEFDQIVTTDRLAGKFPIARPDMFNKTLCMSEACRSPDSPATLRWITTPGNDPMSPRRRRVAGRMHSVRPTGGLDGGRGEKR